MLLDVLKSEQVSAQKEREEEEKERKTTPGHNKTSDNNNVNHVTSEATWVDGIFGGEMRHRVVCHTCGAASDTRQPFLDVSLALPAAAVEDRVRVWGGFLWGKWKLMEGNRREIEYICGHVIIDHVDHVDLMVLMVINGDHGDHVCMVSVWWSCDHLSCDHWSCDHFVMCCIVAKHVTRAPCQRKRRARSERERATTKKNQSTSTVRYI